MKKLGVMIDGLLTLAALWLLCAVVVGYFTDDSTVIIGVSVVAAFGGTYFIGLLARLGKRPAAKKKKLEMLRDKFIFSPPEYAYDFALAALRKKGEVVPCGNLLTVKNTAFAVRLTGEKISLSTLASLYAEACKAGAGRLIILSALGAEDDAGEIAAKLPDAETEIWDYEKVHAFFCHLGSPPTQSLELRRRKKRLTPLRVFDRGNARRFLFTAIVTLLFARFFPYSVLYVVMAAVSLVLAVLCRIDLAGKLAGK